MLNYITYLKTLMRSKKGQGMVEYGLIIGLVAVILIVAISSMTGGLQAIFGRITSELTTAAATSGS